MLQQTCAWHHGLIKSLSVRTFHRCAAYAPRWGSGWTANCAISAGNQRRDIIVPVLGNDLIVQYASYDGRYARAL